MSNIQFSVTKDGKPFHDYTWDEETKTFSSSEDDLVLDFSNIHGVTFTTGDGCTFKTGDDCTFTTGSGCTFKTGPGCTFKTGKRCVVVRRGIFEVIQLPEDTEVRLNDNCKGYHKVNNHTIIIDGKEIKVSEDSYQKLKESLT